LPKRTWGNGAADLTAENDVKECGWVRPLRDQGERKRPQPNERRQLHIRDSGDMLVEKKLSSQFVSSKLRD